MSGSPIVIDMYGTGSKPIINVNKTAYAGVYFENQEYWEVNNLEITNFTGNIRFGFYRPVCRYPFPN